MSGPVLLLPALIAVCALLMFLHGWRLIRTDTIEGLDVGDLVLLNKAQQKVARNRPLTRLGGALVPALRVLLGPKGLRWLDRQVMLAGRPDGATADTVLGNAGTWIVMFGPITILSLLTGQLLLALLSVTAIVIMPMARLSRERRIRQERLDRDLPDFLDILSVTVSAGVAFRPALLRVAERFGGPLAEEMTLTLNQMANGAGRRSAFTHLRDRNDSEALAQFVTAFLQSEELGAPLAQTLKQIALEMRRSSAQRMRRRAAQAAPRVTLVNSMVLVPAILVLVFVGMYYGSGVDFGSLFGGA